MTARTLLRRAWRLRCPACGKGPLFRGWVFMHEHCSACAYKFERENGYFLGAIYINYGLTGGILIAAVLFHFLIYELPPAVLIGAGVSFGLLFPTWFSRYSRSLFMALDLYYHPPEERDFAVRDDEDSAILDR